MAVKKIPDGYHSITPYLYLKNAGQLLNFYKNAFGATEMMRLEGPNGKIGHAEMRIGNSIVMLADEMPEMGATSPQTLGGPGVGILIYVENVDEVFNRAVAAGGKIVRPIKDQFYGDRSGTLIDPSGHQWTVATHIEDVPPEEINRRAAAYMSSVAASGQG